MTHDILLSGKSAEEINRQIGKYNSEGYILHSFHTCSLNGGVQFTAHMRKN